MKINSYKYLMVLGLSLSQSLLANAADNELLYKAGEFQVDIFGLGSEQRITASKSLGAGVGLNYFVSRNIGLGVEAFSYNTGHATVDQVGLNLIGRIPLTKFSGFAPYFMFGSGYNIEIDEYNVNAGGGLEYRLFKNIGAFSDIRTYTSTTKGNDVSLLARVGVRLSF
jgi:hypothetical protein